MADSPDPSLRDRTPDKSSAAAQTVDIFLDLVVNRLVALSLVSLNSLHPKYF